MSKAIQMYHAGVFNLAVSETCASSRGCKIRNARYWASHLSPAWRPPRSGAGRQAPPFRRPSATAPPPAAGGRPPWRRPAAEWPPPDVLHHMNVVACSLARPHVCVLLVVIILSPVLVFVFTLITESVCVCWFAPFVIICVHTYSYNHSYVYCCCCCC